jgi:hypothetical protein
MAFHGNTTVSDIDAKINKRYEDFCKTKPATKAVTAAQIANLFSEARDSLKPFNTPVAHTVVAERDRVPVAKEEKTMQTQSTDHMLRRVRDVVFAAQNTSLPAEHHILSERLPPTVKDLLEALKDGKVRPKKNVTPDFKLDKWDTLDSVLEFRTVEPDHKGFKEACAKLELEAKRVKDAIVANPDPAQAFKAFTRFLEDWEPTGQAN